MRYVALFLIVVLAAPALAAPPSDASIKELMRVMDSQKMMDLAFGQVDAAMQAGIQQALQGKEVTPEVQQAIDRMRGKMFALMKEEMSWPTLEPTFVEIYKKSFSQQEIDGMLAFYKSDAGRAVTAKMPLVMQNSMQLMQQRMQAMTPKLMRIQEEMTAEIAAACKEKCAKAE